MKDTLQESCNIARIAGYFHPGDGEIRQKVKESRRNGLYTEKGYDSFRAYCEGGEISVSRRRADDLVRAVEVSDNLGTRVPNPPTTERQLRPLTVIKDPDEQAKVWDSAVEANDGKAPKDTRGR